MSKALTRGLILFLILFLTVSISTCTFGDSSPAPEPGDTISTATVPPAPVNAFAKVVSQNTINVEWLDNSNNETGFNIYRGNSPVGTVGLNVQSFTDTGLQPGVTYYYAIKAFNQTGESQAALCSIKIPNPPIRIHLEQVGVYDNRETRLRSKGDVYVLISVVDGTNAITVKFPPEPDATYSLEKNETAYVDATIYEADAVADSLTILFTGYESDGGNYEQLAYHALEIAAEVYIPGSGRLLEEIFDTRLSSLIGDLLGQEHDSLGSYELDCNLTNAWRVGHNTKT